MSTASPQGHCSVCGASTTRRCSACTRAGFDLFFCSHEHQKLAWVGHKLACRMSSKDGSFRLPPLTEDELAKAKVVARKPRMHDYSTMSVEKVFEFFLPGECGKKGVESVLEALADSTSFSNYPPAAPSAALMAVRRSLLEQLIDIGYINNPSGFIDGHRLGMQPAYCQATLTGMFSETTVDAAFLVNSHVDLPTAFPFHDHRYVEVQHRALVTASLEWLVCTKPPSTESERVKLRRLQAYTTSELLKAVKKLEERYPEQSKGLATWVGGLNAFEQIWQAGRKGGAAGIRETLAKAAVMQQ